MSAVFLGTGPYTGKGGAQGLRQGVRQDVTSVQDYQARLAHEQAEVQQQRLVELAEQVSVRNTPSERILIWERLHEVTLPRNPVHKLLSVIAAATDLQIEQVQAEQRLRLVAAGAFLPSLLCRCRNLEWNSGPQRAAGRSQDVQSAFRPTSLPVPNSGAVRRNRCLLSFADA